MLTREDFIRTSFETNLFFQRIMKEHLFFIETNLQPVVPAYIMEARSLKQAFEELLAETVHYANGNISKSALMSNEFVTPYTKRAEEVNSMLTGASLNTGITEAELRLFCGPSYSFGNWANIAYCLNVKSLNLLYKVIEFKKRLLSMALECRIFIALYPEMLKHLIQEAEYYMEMLRCLQSGTLPKKALCEKLNFWNHIMGEHAEFIDGMLDPTEKNLKHTAENTAKRFEKLVEDCIKSAENQILKESLQATEGIKDYKMAATIGLLQCEIKSIIPPLLADHVLREANHYLRLLGSLTKS
ncbi:hypothetical protein CDQ84_10920 [Clostridium thermosuccinogenes]|uniref:DUF2935 domain-containing protein n=1 Tax=Clostridium thermosuccinogenes TaxID=84032 RepID=A0A2K2FI42_9CLOT|nr:DUF2935 domain-containing protein [Pseudoclostridium thermosuccinogenes]AUS97052.1 hypothetical protein CDO33_11755 [Pseudoclostridium thermosuccinogenes]PNT96663.1 hypothetical protein CDQ85_10765 [Pseudoclostridium thermosuccinogenes]PNT98456.1 hypothetical protein CDQ84_10920 [Pseudoclostridium thermosuccinogenes]